MKVMKVNSHKDLEKYCDLWLPVWIDSGYELESYITEGIERFIFCTKTGEDFGCFELNPYSFDSSPVNETFPFNHLSILKDKKVIELEKLVIKNEYRGSIKRLIEIFTFFTEYIIFEKKYDYLIALLNPVLYNTLVKKFNIPITRLIGKMNGNNNYIPAMLEVKALEKSNFGKTVMKKYLQKV